MFSLEWIEIEEDLPFEFQLENLGFLRPYFFDVGFDLWVKLDDLGPDSLIRRLL